MGHDAVAVLREALALPGSDRADIAAELLASLPAPDTDHDLDDDGWLREIDQRARRALQGESPSEPWEAVEQRLTARFPEA